MVSLKSDPLMTISKRAMKTLDIDECAEFLKIDRTTALALAGKGELPGAKIGRAWVFLDEDLAEYLRAQVRAQQRKRQVEADTQKGLDAAVARIEPQQIMAPARPGRKARSLPNLDLLPEFPRQVAAA